LITCNVFMNTCIIIIKTHSRTAMHCLLLHTDKKEGTELIQHTY